MFPRHTATNTIIPVMLYTALALQRKRCIQVTLINEFNGDIPIELYTSAGLRTSRFLQYDRTCPLSRSMKTI